MKRRNAAQHTYVQLPISFYIYENLYMTILSIFMVKKTQIVYMKICDALFCVLRVLVECKFELRAMNIRTNAEKQNRSNCNL